MTDNLSSLGEEEVRRLIEVIESLENSAFDFLQLEVGGMKVVLGKGNPSEYLAATQSASRGPEPAPATPIPPPPITAAPSATPSSEPTAAASPATVAPADGTVEIKAPVIGIFYAQPEPGAPPYVTVGSLVTRETTIALIEVMKMFNAVAAGVEGVVTEVLVENNELVEYGQPLFRIRPA